MTDNTTPTEPTPLSEQFPEEVSDLIGFMEEQQATKVMLREQLTGGKSGAFAAVVDCEGAIDGLYILKAAPKSADGPTEVERHDQAAKIGAFSGKIPSVVATVDTDDRYCLLTHIAGGSRRTWRQLLGSPKLLHSAYEKLSETLWTPGLISLGGQLKKFELLRSYIGYRLQPDAGGRIHERIETFFPELKETPYFFYINELLPNPFHLACTQSVLGKPINPLLGPIHGDLHSANLFVTTSQNGEVSDICIIDCADFKPSEPFFFDHAYFELSTLLNTCENLSPERWLELCQALLPGDTLKVEKLDPGVRAWASDLHSAREAAFSWIGEAYPARKDDLFFQQLLTQVATGMAFLHKKPREGSGSFGFTGEQYEKALIWSSVALQEILKSEPPGILAQPTRIPAIGPRASVTEQIDDEDWEKVSGFEASGLNILVLSPGVRKKGDPALNTLFRVRWGLVLDCSHLQNPDPSVLLDPRPVRAAWPNGEPIYMGILERGMYWLYLNGNEGISECEPSRDYTTWLRNYRRWLEDSLCKVGDELAPPAVRVVCFGDDFDSNQLTSLLELMDIAFRDKSSPALVCADSRPFFQDHIDAVVAGRKAVLSRLETSTSLPAQARQMELIRIPCRDVDGNAALEVVPEKLALRVQRDLTIVHRGLAKSIPTGRVFGKDFLRGMTIEWAELAANLDVKREVFPEHREMLLEQLSKNTIATHELLHNSSAGGTTLSRRLAWMLMENYPTVLINQFTEDTSSYLREIFQFTNFPVLILMESKVVTESAREAMLRQLREDNTRGVFLWVSRLYQKSTNNKVMQQKLSDDEARNFLDSYVEQVKSLEKKRALQELASSTKLMKLRSPFFFGLFAFEDEYVGIDKLLEDTLDGLEQGGRDLITYLCLLTVFSNEGFPSHDFAELCARFNDDKLAYHEDSPFAFEYDEQIHVAHALLAEETLKRLAREPGRWKADVDMWSRKFIANVSSLSSANSDRIRGLVTALFVTRDTSSALDTDAKFFAGGLVYKKSRFAPLIEEIPAKAGAREVLRLLVGKWSMEPHFALHLARHLLYEVPTDITAAIEVMEAATRMPEAENDDAVVHMLGMCYRQRMLEKLDSAALKGTRLEQIEAEVRDDYESAVGNFDKAIAMEPMSEFGRIATVQTVRRLITRVKSISGVPTVPGLLKSDQTSRWYMDAISLAEEQISMLRNNATRQESRRVQKEITEWQITYGQIDAVISKLRKMSKKYNDPYIRRALYSTIQAKHKRMWQRIPDGDLRTIEESARQNVEAQGVRDVDIRTWLMSYRHLRTFDVDVAIRRLEDWHQIRPNAVEPVFYLYVYRTLQWLNTGRHNKSLADEALRWFRICKEKRQIGQRNWGYEWLLHTDHRYNSIHFKELGFDPVRALMSGGKKAANNLATLARVNATLTSFLGPQRATLDLGHNIKMHVTPRDSLNKDDEGSQVSVLVSFGYDGIVGRDSQLVGSSP